MKTYKQRQKLLAEALREVSRWALTWASAQEENDYTENASQAEQRYYKALEGLDEVVCSKVENELPDSVSPERNR